MKNGFGPVYIIDADWAATCAAVGRPNKSAKPIVFGVLHWLPSNRVDTYFSRLSCQTTCTTPWESITMAGLVTTPERETFKGWSQESVEDWAEAHDGVPDEMKRALANKNPTTLNIHPYCREANLVII